MKEPDWSVLPDHLPASVGRLLRRSLEKDPRRRLQAIGEARILIEDLIAHPESAQETVAQPLVTQRPVPLWRRALPWGIATALALALAGMMLWVALRLAPRPPTRPIALGGGSSAT